MAKKSKQKSSFIDWLTVETLGIIMGIIGLAVLFAGHLDQYRRVDLHQLAQDSYGNFAEGLVEIAVTALIIDRLARRRESIAEKKRLIREMGSRDNGTAIRAVDDLSEMGYIADGSVAEGAFKYAHLDGALLADADLHGAYMSFAKLAGADLRHANLEDAILRAADLTEAMLIHTNLRGAKLLDANLHSANLHGTDITGANLAGADMTEARGLTDERLAKAESLHRAILPNGVRYDGRFNLHGDLPDSIDKNDVKAMALHYDISVEAYKHGQEWARQHLERVRAMPLTHDSSQHDG